MRPNFLQLLLLWAELKKLYLNQTAGKGRRTGSGHQFKKPKRSRNRWRLPIILICGLLSLKSATRAQSKPSETANARSGRPKRDRSGFVVQSANWFGEFSLRRGSEKSSMWPMVAASCRADNSPETVGELLISDEDREWSENTH